MAAKHHNFIRFLGYVRPYVKYLALAVVGGIAKFTVPLLVPQVTRHLLDNVFLDAHLTRGQKLHELLLYAGGMMAVFIFIYAPFVYLRHLYSDKAGHRAVFQMRCDLYYRILRMSASFFQRNKTGAILTRLISDVQLAQNLIGTALTNGFDTEVGERGSALSGGQRQRITIARAFLKDPKILILDEATANLDPESEHLIQGAMKRLIVGRTTFIIAHRLSTIINADRILVLCAGKVIESGTHHQLIAHGGLYREFHKKQFASAETN